MTLGNYLVARFIGDPAATYDAWLFDGENFPQDGEFDWTQLFSVTGGQTPISTYVTQIGTGLSIGAPSFVLRWLWYEALGEWN